jgi:cobalamin-dependent methionine synthase I
MTLVIEASIHLKNHLIQRYALGELSNMSPGGNKEWPITQQKELFSVLGDVEGMIGVRLAEGYTMVPMKSRSGIHFSS